MKRARVGIINVTGYVGVELARLLHQHPEVELTSVTGRSAAGQKLSAVFPHLASIDLTIEPELGEVDLAFSAMPHKESAVVIVPLLKSGIKVIDASADFRLKDAAEYEHRYNVTHPAPELLKQSVYGLPELHRPEITSAQLVSIPGCYPTGAILALAPVVKGGLIEPEVIVDSKSGTSGAGRAPTQGTHYSEVNEDITAYALEGHRHLPEITQELKQLRPRQPLSVTFVPHLTPMTRGILTTCYATLSPGKIPPNERGREELRELFQDFYKDKPFVRIAETSPHTKHTWGSNMCLIYPTIAPDTGRLVIISCLDNLVKGAAGGGVQNMNIMLGLPEVTGLQAPAVYP
ncbi:MAG: N-acetyl-gamma-glutamyl-phosphate reductase [Dehalococcoidales bacterium]|nr:MAG: N-acetyl-gamma-glutamyl-phosphate reductase [Dehalococcoidales bacterium]